MTRTGFDIFKDIGNCQDKIRDLEKESNVLENIIDSNEIKVDVLNDMLIDFNADLRNETGGKDMDDFSRNTLIEQDLIYLDENKNVIFILAYQDGDMVPYDAFDKYCEDTGFSARLLDEYINSNGYDEMQNDIWLVTIMH